jgi:hypothetical protein
LITSARVSKASADGFTGGQIPVEFSQAAPGVAAGEGTSPAKSIVSMTSVLPAQNACRGAAHGFPDVIVEATAWAHRSVEI